MHHRFKRFLISHCSFPICEDGFTIVELIMYMGILLILLAVLSQLFTSSIESQLSSQSFSAVQQDGRYVLNRLVYDIQNATSITTPASLGSSSATLVLVSGGTTYTYATSSGNLTVNSVQLNNFNTKVSNISFKRLGNVGGKPTIQLGYTLTSRVTDRGGKNEVKSYSSTAGIQ